MFGFASSFGTINRTALSPNNKTIAISFLKIKIKIQYRIVQMAFCKVIEHSISLSMILLVA